MLTAALLALPGLSEQNASVVLSEQSAGPTRLAKQDGLAELAGLSGLAGSGCWGAV